MLFPQNVRLSFNQWYLHSVPWELVSQWHWSLFHCPTSHRIWSHVCQRCHSEAGMRDIKKLIINLGQSEGILLSQMGDRH